MVKFSKQKAWDLNIQEIEDLISFYLSELESGKSLDREDIYFINWKVSDGHVEGLEVTQDLK